MSDIEDMRRKLKARKGRPGFKANVAELERRITYAEGGSYRSSITGQFVTMEYALANPDTTYRSET